MTEQEILAKAKELLPYEPRLKAYIAVLDYFACQSDEVVIQLANLVDDWNSNSPSSVDESDEIAYGLSEAFESLKITPNEYFNEVCEVSEFELKNASNEARKSAYEGKDF